MMQSPATKVIMAILNVLVFNAPREAAFSPVFAAASPIVRAEREKYKGGYLEVDYARGAKLTKPYTHQGESEELAEELWKTSEEVVEGMDL